MKDALAEREIGRLRAPPHRLGVDRHGRLSEAPRAPGACARPALRPLPPRRVVARGKGLRSIEAGTRLGEPARGFGYVDVPLRQFVEETARYRRIPEPVDTPVDRKVDARVLARPRESDVREPAFF